jgi:hypothetical protein
MTTEALRRVADSARGAPFFGGEGSSGSGWPVASGIGRNDDQTRCGSDAFAGTDCGAGANMVDRQLRRGRYHCLNTQDFQDDSNKFGPGAVTPEQLMTALRSEGMAPSVEILKIRTTVH